MKESWDLCQCDTSNISIERFFPFRRVIILEGARLWQTQGHLDTPDRSAKLGSWIFDSGVLWKTCGRNHGYQGPGYGKVATLK